MAKHIADNEFIGSLGQSNYEAGQNKYAEIIRQYPGKCASCGSEGYIWLKDASDYLETIYTFVNKYHSTTGWQYAMEPATQGDNTTYSKDGMNHLMHVANAETRAVQEFDAEFETVEGQFNCPRQQCRFDILLSASAGNPQTSIECKSYQNLSQLPINQFLAYFSRIATSMDELEYRFKKEKLSVTGNPVEAMNNAKQGIKAFFNKNGYASQIYNANPILINNMNLKLNNGLPVNSESGFITYCSEAPITSRLFDFVKLK